MSTGACVEGTVESDRIADGSVLISLKMLGDFLVQASLEDFPAMYIRDVQQWNGYAPQKPAYTCVVSWSSANHGPDGAPAARSRWTIPPPPMELLVDRVSVSSLASDLTPTSRLQVSEPIEQVREPWTVQPPRMQPLTARAEQLAAVLLYKF